MVNIWHPGSVARTQTLVQLTDELVLLLDRAAVERGVSRSAVIRQAIEEHLKVEERRAIDAAIREGYLRHAAEYEEEMGDWIDAVADIWDDLEWEDDE
jgi:predicted transcriptional regulator